MVQKETNQDGTTGMDYKLLMNTAILAGEIMLKSGAETYRVEDTIQHILNTSHAETVETIVLMTGIVATLDNPDIDTISVVKRVENRGMNLSCIDRVNEISRQYCAKKITLEEAYKALQNVKVRQYKSWQYNLATVFVCTGFTPLFSGGMSEAVGAAVIGIILALIVTLGKRLRINGFILNILSSAGIACVATCLKWKFPLLDVNVVIISCIMPLVPGVAITNAIRDTLQGDYLSGTARILEAFLTAAAIAIGIGAGIAFMRLGYPGGVLF